jgi:serine protease
MSRPSILQSAVRRARAAAPIAGAALLLGLTGAAASATPAGAAGAAGSPGAQPSVVLTVPTALHHGYRHGAVPRETRDVSGVEALGYALQVPGHQSARAASKLVRYGGGLTAGDLTAAGVTTGPPQVYLVFMGDQWGTESTSGGQVHFSGDPDAFAPALQTLYAGLGTGGEQWSGTMTQYCDGAAFGATVCSEGDTQIPYPTGGVLAGIWYDNSASGPNSATAQETAGLTGHQLAAEAEAAASYFGNSDQASNRDTQYVIVSPTGTNPDGWTDPRGGYCAYHDDTHDGSIDGGGAVGGPIVAFTNLPYVPDAGADCGAGTVTSPGTLDGATEAASHEYAETITDQFPEGNPVPGWINTGGEEVGDLCAYVSTGPGAMFDLALGDGNVVVQGIWSNKDGGCSDGEANYTYTPTLAKFGPASGTAGSSVTVTGTNLGTATSVLFGGVPGSVTSDTPGAVTATVPVGAVSGPVTVDTTFGDVTSTTAFHVAPSITSFAPTVTTRGATLAITGSGLSAAKKVVVGGKKAVITSDSATQIDVTVGPKAVSGSVSVTTKYGTASLAGLTIS